MNRKEALGRKSSYTRQSADFYMEVLTHSLATPSTQLRPRCRLRQNTWVSRQAMLRPSRMSGVTKVPLGFTEAAPLFSSAQWSTDRYSLVSLSFFIPNGLQMKECVRKYQAWWAWSGGRYALEYWEAPHDLVLSAHSSTQRSRDRLARSGSSTRCSLGSRSSTHAQPSWWHSTFAKSSLPGRIQTSWARLSASS